MSYKNLTKVLLILAFSLNVGAEESPLFYGDHSTNFVNRWAFQKLCDHTYDLRPSYRINEDECAVFHPEKVKKGDIVFVRDIEKFIQQVHPLIKNPYIMLTAGDQKDQVRPEFEPFLQDPKIIAWFSVHPCCRWFSEKFRPIPLGINMRKVKNEERWSHYSKFFSNLRSKKKDQLLHLNFGTHSIPRAQKNYKDRIKVFNIFKRKAYCSVIKNMGFENYLKEMARYKFTLSPEGYGPDCYRNWEALLVGTVPIVKSSALDELYKDLPVLIVDEWEEITPGLLELTWQEFTRKRFNIEKLFIEYWAKKIYAVRDDFFKKNQ